MTPLIKRSPLAKRIKALNRELAAVDSDLKALSKGRAKDSRRTPARGGRAEESAGARPPHPPEGPDGAGQAETPDSVEEEVRRIGSRIRDKRFADYLSTSFQTVRPLRHERRIQRNKAILMAVLAALALFWVLYRFFM